MSELPKRDDSSSLITVGEKYTLESKLLNEERAYWVNLPASYHETIYAPQNYPVLYFLDGDAHFRILEGISNFMGAGICGNIQTPEFISVGILNTDRLRDLTPTHTKTDYDGEEKDHFENSGGGNLFLKFVQEELFPEIESHFRTLPYRIFSGHSLGGLLVLHTLFAAPDMFQAHIAIDPSTWWDDEVITKKAELALTEQKELKGAAYISLANNVEEGNENSQKMGRTGRKLASILEKLSSSRYRFKWQYFGSEDHGSVPLLSFYYGLLHIFEGYKADWNKAYKQPSYLTQHFEAFSKKFGMTFLPPEGFVDNIGLVIGSDFDKALEAYKINAFNYPTSSNAYKRLGEVYQASGNMPLAIENYQKALSLNPSLEELERKLDEFAGRSKNLQQE